MSSLTKTIVALHISTVLNIVAFLVAFYVLYPFVTFIPAFRWVFGFAALVTVAQTIFVEIVARKLKEEQYWAWVAGIIVCGFYTFSAYFILGIVGMTGLLQERERFMNLQ